MTNEEFNLSEKIDYGIACVGNDGIERGWLQEEDVKEFIRRLKENIDSYCKLNQYKSISQQGIFNGVDKLAGDKLI